MFCERMEEMNRLTSPVVLSRGVKVTFELGDGYKWQPDAWKVQIDKRAGSEARWRQRRSGIETAAFYFRQREGG